MKKGLRTYNPAGMRDKKGILRIKIFDLADKMAFVTGAGRGMGQAMAITLISDKDYMANALQRIPLRRAGETHDAVDSAVFLASAASDFITGQTLLVDGDTRPCKTMTGLRSQAHAS